MSTCLSLLQSYKLANLILLLLFLLLASLLLHFSFIVVGFFRFFLSGGSTELLCRLLG